jgi:hypothetical protein
LSSRLLPYYKSAILRNAQCIRVNAATGLNSLSRMRSAFILRVARPAKTQISHRLNEVPGHKGACAWYLHEDRVHYFRMKNITLSVDEQLIKQARLLAKSQHKTLNAMFREWLEQFTARSGGTQEFDALMKRLKHVQAGRRFSRDEMNER